MEKEKGSSVEYPWVTQLGGNMCNVDSQDLCGETSQQKTKVKSVEQLLGDAHAIQQSWLRAREARRRNRMS